MKLSTIRRLIKEAGETQAPAGDFDEFMSSIEQLEKHAKERRVMEPNYSKQDLLSDIHRELPDIDTEMANKMVEFVFKHIDADVTEASINVDMQTAPTAEELDVGEPVKIVGNVDYHDKVGHIDSFGRDKRFVIVDLGNDGLRSFHSSDVSYYAADDNDEAEDGDIEESVVNEAANVAEVQLTGDQFHSSVKRIMQDIAQEYQDQTASASSSPSAPDTSKFRSTRGGMIEYASKVNVHGGYYGSPKTYLDFIKIGGGLNPQVTKDIFYDFSADMEEQFGITVAPGLHVKTTDGYTFFFPSFEEGTNWGGFGFTVSKAKTEDVAEGDSQEPKGRMKSDGTRSHSTYGSRDNYKLGGPESSATPVKSKDFKKDALNILNQQLKKKGVAEDVDGEKPTTWYKDNKPFSLQRNGATFHLIDQTGRVVKNMQIPPRYIPMNLEDEGYKMSNTGREYYKNPGWFKEAAGDNPEDVITVDVPLFIRLMEYAREDAKTDMDLHVVTEKLVAMSAEGRTLSMADYDAIISTDTVEEETVNEVSPHNFDSDIDYYDALRARKPQRQEPDEPASYDDDYNDRLRFKPAAAKPSQHLNNEEGNAPNGKKYNNTVTFSGGSASANKYAADSFADYHWGAKDVVDAKQDGDNYVLYVVDNHKYGMWKPWKEAKVGEAAGQKEKSAFQHGYEAGLSRRPEPNPYAAGTKENADFRHGEHTGRADRDTHYESSIAKGTVITEYAAFKKGIK